MRAPKPKPQFCKNNHDTLITGRDKEGRCVVCRKEWYARRAREVLTGERIVKNTKQFCPRNHDTFICGRDKQGKCRICSRILSENWNRENPEAKAEYSAEYRATHKEEIKIGQKEWRDEHKDVVKHYSLQYSYKITLAQYSELLLRQNNLCLGCLRPQSEFEKAFCVDHDHSCCPGEKSCGKCIRGLLCGPCNRVLGQANDNIGILRRLADYVEVFTKASLNRKVGIIDQWNEELLAALKELSSPL